MTIKISPVQARWIRLRRSGLVEPFVTPEAAAGALFGVQAQILPAAALALWHRTSGLTAAAVEDLLYQRRTLVKLWGQRGTLHLYPAADWPLVFGAVFRGRSRQTLEAARSGNDDAYEKIVSRVAGLLRRRGTLTRAELKSENPDLDEEHFYSWGGIFAELVYRGLACHAAPDGSSGRFACRESWLPRLDWDPPSFEEANREVARRFFRAYGPAGEPDFRYWRSARAAESRQWVSALPNLVEAEVDGSRLYICREEMDGLQSTPPEREAWPVRLLYRFDPLLLGCRDKGWLVESADYARVWRPAGHIEATLLEHGRIAGTWRYDRRAGGMAVTVYPFRPLPGYARAAIDTQARAIAAFFGLTLSDVKEFEGHNT